MSTVPGVSKNARGRPSDSPEVRISKTLSYILRHGAEKEGLKLRPDGYVRVTELLARPKFNGVDLAMIQKLVAENDKQRYQLLLEPTEPASGVVSADAPGEAGTWWIRANQGHTLKVEALELTPINSPEELPVAVHGTNAAAYEIISKQGLSKMKRNHIHLATGLPSSGVKSGMRANSEVMIYINVPKAMEAGLKFELSANGVVLTAGNDKGFIPPDLFLRIEKAVRKPSKPQPQPQGQRPPAKQVVQTPPSFSASDFPPLGAPSASKK